jgi:hypothetical protein
VAAEVVAVDLPSYCKIIHYKLWPPVVVVVAEQVIKAAAVIVQGRTGRPMPDTTVKQGQIIQLTVVVAAVAVADTMAEPVAEAMVVHTAAGLAQATLAVRQEILVPAGVSVIQMDLHQMAEHQVANQVSLFRIMWDWVGRLDVPVAMDI